jgi:hypothetical protein
METIALASRITQTVAAVSAITTVVREPSTITPAMPLTSATAVRVDLASPIYLESTT